MRPEVLLVFLFYHEECSAMLRGIAHYERSHRPWRAYIDDEAQTEKDPGWIRSRKWSGVINRHTSPAVANECLRLGVPLVDLNDCAPYEAIPKIRPDNRAIGHMGAEHFLERGFSRLGFSGFSNCAWSCERRDGFVEAAGLAQVGCHDFEVEYPGDLTPAWDAEQTKALSQWLRALPKPIGVMACNDMRAFEVMAACEAAHLLVPEEVAVLGVNNDEIRCELAFPPLSSVATDSFQSGYRAAEALDRLMRGEPLEQSYVRIDPRGIVTRQSTDILAIDDRHVAAALSYIREHAFEGLTVEKLLRPAGASRSQLEKKFRRFLGRSPQAEIRRIQLDRVRSLLANTDFPLKKIAELTGFEHVEYMHVLFKKTVGLTPGEYRRRHQAPPR
jgi:LacI family transcriptional regulator